MKPEEQRGVCKTIAEATGRRGDRRLGYFGVEKARTSLEVLVKFRNICAHDERLYCAVVGDRKHVNYEKMAWMLERFLTEEEFSAFLRDLLGLFEKGIRAERAIAFTLRPLGFFELKEELERRLGDGGRW